MQTQAQIPGQVPTQPGGNPLPSQGGASMGGLSRAWHSEGDLAIRRTIMEKILALFQRRKPHASLEWQQKLPDLVKRIEEALYKDAASKEEYEDLSTLEPRLQAVATRLVSSRTNQSFVQPPPHPAMAMPSHPVASMIPTPGIPASNGCTMIPTPGSDISSLPPQRTGMNHMMPVSGNNSSSGGLLQVQAMSSTGKMSSMIPTPGLGSSGTFPASSDVGNNSLNVQSGMKHGQIRPPALMGTHGGMPGLGGGGGGQMIPTPGLNTSQQAMCRTPPYSRIDSGASGHLYRNVNNQGGMGAPPPMRKSGTFGFVNGNTGNGFPLNNNGQQHLMNGNTNYIGSSGYANSSQLGNMQAQQHPAQQQQHLQQQQQVQQHLGWSSGERHSRATVDLTETGSMHDSSMRIGGAGGSSQASKMIPVPGLPPQGNTWLPQQQLEQSNYRQGVSNQRAPVVKNRAPYPSTQLYAPKQPGGGVGGQELDSQLASGSSSEQPMKTQQQQQQQQQQQSQTGPQPQHLNTSQLQLQKDKQALIQQAEQQMRETHMSGSDEHNNQVKEEHTEPNNKQDRQSSQGVGVGLNSNEAVSIGNAADEGQRAQQYFKQQKWLLFLRHASKCTAPEGQCHSTPHCHTARQLWSHITQCTDPNCQYARCQASRKLLRHHQQCRDPKCPVCGPVRQILFQQRAQAVQAQSVNRNSSNLPTLHTSVTEPPVPKRESEANQGQHHPAKRLKVENTPGSLESRSVNPPLSLSQENPSSAPSQTNPLSTKTPQVVPAPLSSLSSCSVLTSINVESESNSIKTEPVSNAVKVETASSCHVNQSAVKVTPIKSEVLSNDVEMPSAQIETSSFKTEASGLKMETLSMTEGQVQAPLVQPKAEMSVSVAVKGMLQVKQEVVSNTSVSSAQDNSSSGKPWKPKIKGVSLTELFTPDQIRDHIKSLRQWVGQSRVKAEKNQAMELQMNENSCQLCAVEKLTFEPSPIYCSPCGARIKKNAMFWTHGLGETRHYFCIPCYNEIRTETVEVDGLSFAKSKLEKRKNDEETEEAWVQCDKCEAWQHQICALFNGRRNEGGQAEYMCPRCQIKEIENGERKPLPQSAVLGAKDLPRTQISDFIEQRLARKLKQERLERARAQGKTFDEVPGAEPLVLRVVSCVDKKLEVKSHFLQLFQEEDYPAEFSYRSKALLLFQKIEGVEVCLFGMYVQEFGAECSQPNQRRVYLSYLDSVKYFRPDVRTTSGEALRTFVYHEILIGYLDYCKKRGLTSCYIWACPPLKGEDYILYCHPEIQKTPKADKLREWYLMMLRKASNENVVVELTNMYDHFFVCSGESKAKVTAARLPYFEGDYWPGAAEDMIMQLQQEQEDGRKIQKKGKTKKTVTKRSSKAAGHTELSSNSSKDLQLMQKLGESIFPMKEDFIMVHLQYACTHCCNFILSGHRWVCKQCKNFHLCDRCYEVESKLEDRDRHPTNSKEAHLLVPVEVSDVPADTRDKDEVIESEFFDTRQAFLSLCQGNHYQYDTLRRGKHSSIMVLYHLHNPTAPAFVTSCNACHHDIESGQGWRCEICPDYDLCNACHQKEDTPKHPHKLAPHPSLAEHQAQNKEARQLRVVQLRKMLDLLIHASQCFTAQCQYPNCRRVKGLFRHGMNCKIRASGGCPLCKKMWYLLQLHARACKESECRVPRCKDLKEHLRRLQSQMESRRRAAVKEMMRQRAAEAAGSAC